MTSAVASTTMLGMHVTGMPRAVVASRSTVLGQMAMVATTLSPGLALMTLALA